MMGFILPELKEFKKIKESNWPALVFLNLLGSVGCRVGPWGSGLFRSIPRIPDWTGIWWVWGPDEVLGVLCLS